MWDNILLGGGFLVLLGWSTWRYRKRQRPNENDSDSAYESGLNPGATADAPVGDSGGD